LLSAKRKSNAMQ